MADDVPPKDKWNLIYLTLMLHGLGTLTAWNMFITAKDYFEKYKLAGTDYSVHYLIYVGWASQIPNLLFCWLNVFIKIGGDLSTRIIWSLISEALIFVITIILAMVDTSQYPAVFFWLTMVSVFFLNGFNSIYQNSIFGIAARLPPKYTGAVVLGTNVCGTLVVCLSLTVKLFDSYRTSAIYFFIGGMFVLFVCFDTYIALPLNRFYRYYDTLEQRNNPILSVNQNASEAKTPYMKLFKQTAMQLYNVFIIFFVTLAVFPAVMSNIASTTKFLGDNFVIVTCFLTFNAFAVIGNITANMVQYPSPKRLFIFTTVRLLFIPFFLVCNYVVKDRTMPVLIASDWVYWAGGALLGWSSGHGSSLGMMYVGGTVEPEYASKTGMIGGATLVTGIMVGITFSRLCPIIVTLDAWKSN